MKNILAIQSHVVFGHAGNSAAEFPMRRLGANVWPLNTVQFSNHTQYGKWTGCVMPPSHLTEIVQGIADIGQLAHCDAVLSGYLGSAEQGEHILGIVRQVKAANPQAKYFCDPVMGIRKRAVSWRLASQSSMCVMRYPPAILSRLT
ncbi:pyridoxamine kinase [Salmonella enterica subsp. enterica]|uniref:pyridoxal kinase n=1 Tax=Salmonella enterica I TaxID=59201 RepID=A0A379WAE5_SALET|nr:pyridoxamine kinase [Salmonella enterica subsp. enterica]VEA37630.1 pyridoxamine kinase [Salmonella enterica subsp. enterica]